MPRICFRCARPARPGILASCTLPPAPPPSPLGPRGTPHLVRPLHVRSGAAFIWSASRAEPWTRYPSPSRLHSSRLFATTTTSSSSSTDRRGIVCPAHSPPAPPPDFEPVEDDLPPGSTLAMTLTDSAVRQILRAQTAAANPELALRLAVESGGCHGYQYKMQVTPLRAPDDYLFLAPTEEGTARLVVDAASLPLVNGSTIDYATELIGSAFKIRDNPQSKDAGCGCGVSWELKDLDL